jgi:hypothetical protein
MLSLFLATRCAQCENDELDRKTALRIAIETYQELASSKYVRPNQVTFAAFITVLGKLVPRGQARDLAIRSVFKTAANDGFVDEIVVRRMQSTVNKEQLRDIFPTLAEENASVILGLLPSEWSRNTCTASPLTAR